jgi:hypothetical protein
MKQASGQSKRNTKKHSGLNPHDKFARKVMDDPKIAGDLLRHYAEPIIAKYVDLNHLKSETTQNFGKGLQELIKDIAFASHLIDKKGKSEVIIIAEHKSTPEPFVLLQLLVYLALSWYKRWNDAGRPQSTKKFRLPMPILVVLYNGKEKWEGELNIKSLVSSVPPELEPFIPQVKVLFVRLNQFDKHNLPGKPETQAVVESMIRAADGTFVAGLESVIGHFKNLSLDSRIKDLINSIFHYCTLVEGVTPDAIDRAIGSAIKGKEGEKMSQADKKGIWTEGYESGEVNGSARSIIRFLNCRFQKVPKSVKDKVNSIVDIDHLDKLTDQAAECKSLDEFTKALQSQ